MNLAAAMADRGEIDEALDHYGKALGIAAARNDKALADLIRARIRVLRPASAFGGN
jgi:hypothetical protein